MANSKKIDRFYPADSMRPEDSRILTKKYYDPTEPQKFYFPFGSDVFQNIGSWGLRIDVNNVGRPATATIQLKKRTIVEAILHVIKYGVLTQSAVQQLTSQMHNGQQVSGLVLYIGKSSGEIIILLDLYILDVNGNKVIISGDGSGGENLTPTKIPPGR